MFLVPGWPLNFSRGDAQGRHMAEDETGEVPKLPPDARLESLDRAARPVAAGGSEEDRKAQPDANYRAGQLVMSH